MYFTALIFLFKISGHNARSIEVPANNPLGHLDL